VIRSWVDDLDEEERGMVERLREEVCAFIRRRWRPEEWQTGWWITPLVGVCIIPDWMPVLT
jgi:hypothetical protein